MSDLFLLIDVNVKGVLYGITAVLPQMISQKSSQVINVSSVAGHLIFSASTVYSATKHAVRVISEGFRQQMTAHIQNRAGCGVAMCGPSCIRYMVRE